MSANVVGEPIALTDPRDGSLRVFRKDDARRVLIVIQVGQTLSSFALDAAGWRALAEALAGPPPVLFDATPTRTCRKCGRTDSRQGWAAANLCGACMCRPFLTQDTQP